MTRPESLRALRSSAPLLALVLALSACSSAVQPPAPEAEVLEITLRPDSPHQTIHSFGASDAWSLQFVGRYWPVEKRERIADLLFSRELDAGGSPRGIGLSAWRFNLGAGSAAQGSESGIRDEWRRAESFLADGGGYDWSRQAGQRWFLRAAAKRGVEELTAFVNSPPVAFTRNGKAFSSGGEASNLPPEHYADFARYLRDVLLHLERSEGVTFDYLSPVNEPQWDWDGGQEGSPWLNGEIAAVVREISAALQEGGVAAKIEIPEAGKLTYLYEDADRPGRGDQAAAFFSPASPDYVGDLPNVAQAVVGHSYYTTWGIDALVDVRSRLRERLEGIDPDLEFRMSEYCVLENNPQIQGRGRDLGMNTALYVARVIHADLAIADATSWQWWVAVSPYDYKDGLVYIDHNRTDGEIYESKLLWTLGQYSRFIRPGMQRIEVERSDGLSTAKAIGGTLVSAYREPAGSGSVVVLVNQEAREVALRVRGGAPEYRMYRTSDEPGVDLHFSGAREAGETIVLPARSVVTLVAD